MKSDMKFHKPIKKGGVNPSLHGSETFGCHSVHPDEEGSRPSVHGRARKSDGTARPRPAIDPFPRVHISLLAPPTSIIAKLFTTSFSVDLTVERSALLLARSFAMHKKVPAQTDRMRKSFLPWKLENLAVSPISRRLGKTFNKLHFNFSIPICENVPSLSQIHKKRRIVGRVRCKNIKSECPAPTCDDPVLLPGRCCKVCPGQMDSKY